AEPNVERFSGRNWNGTLALDPPDDGDELVDCLLAGQHRLVADHYGVDVAVATRQRDRGLNLLLVPGIRYDLAVGADNVLVDPEAERDLEPELGSNRGHQLDAAGGAVGADVLSVGAENLQIGADLLRPRPVAVVGMLRSRVGRVGNTGERGVDVGPRLVPVEQPPQAGMHADDERHHGSDGAHRTTTT